MKEIYYYEKIAAELMGITPDQLFVKKKDDEKVLARYLCAYYRREILHVLPGAAVKRYNLDHSMMPHIMKTIKNYFDTNDERSIIVRNFLSSCRVFTNSSISTPDEKIKNMVTEKIESIGYELYIDSLGKSLYMLMGALHYENDRKKEVKKKCIDEAVTKLKELYAYYS